MPATDSLAGAIVDAFLADTGGCVAAMPGGIWHGQAEEGTVLPYCEMQTPDGPPPLLTSGKDYIETNPVTLTVWAAGLAVAEPCGNAVLALFNRPAPFAFATAKLVSFLQRGSFQPNPSERRDGNGDVIYSLDLRFEAQVQRAKP